MEASNDVPQKVEGQKEEGAPPPAPSSSTARTTSSSGDSVIPANESFNMISSAEDASPLPPVRDLEENSSSTRNSLVDYSSSFAGKATAGNGRARSSLLNAKQRAAAKIATKKNSRSPENEKEEPFEESFTVSQGAVNGRADESCHSPAVMALEENHTSPLEENSHDEEILSDNQHHDGSEGETPSLIVMARLVEDDQQVKDFIDEHVERRIQEGIESRLREADSQQYRPTTTIVAETIVLAHSSDIVHKQILSTKSVNTDETRGYKKLCGLHPRMLGFVGVVLVILAMGAVTGVIMARQAQDEQPVKPATESPSVAPVETIPPKKLQVLQRIAPWVIRNTTKRNQDQEHFHDPASPQFHALDWLSVDSNNLSEDRRPDIVLERYVLAVLYFSTDGPNWAMDNYDFLTAMDVCSWNNNRDFDDPTTARGVSCGMNQSKVEMIWLNQEGLSGTIPWELSLLTDVWSLWLPGNHLIGAIPTELGQLNRLQEFAVKNNQLEGKIPSEIGRLTNLQWLDISLNSLTGTLPTELGHLTELWYFMTFTNHLNGTVPVEFSKLTGLEYFSVHQNDLEGTIPTDLGQMTMVLDFRMSSNQFTGKLPTELGRLTNVQFLSVEDNHLTGTIPTHLGQLRDVVRLYINMNDFHGTIPTELCELTDLVFLWLGDNSLTGTLPKSLGNLTSIASLSLANNRFVGTLPTELGQLISLLSFPVHINKLYGTIPTEMGQLTNMLEMRLNDNFLTGQLPTELGRLALLKVLHVEMNEFSGSLPTTLGELNNLKEFLFHNNRFTGSAEALCWGNREWDILQGDCSATTGKAEIECQCCSICCNLDGEDCQSHKTV